jgi:hypothetical protein
MKKKYMRLTMGIALFAAVLLGLLAVPYCWRSPVNRANVFRVQRGMQPSEVEAILGRPTEIFQKPGNSTSAGPVWRYWSPVPLAVPSQDWPGGRDDVDLEWLVHVQFDSAGVVWNVGYCASPATPSWFQRIRPF